MAKKFNSEYEREYEVCRTTLYLLASEKCNTIDDAVKIANQKPDLYKSEVSDKIPIGSELLVEEYKRLQSVIVAASAGVSAFGKITGLGDGELDELAECLCRSLAWERWESYLNYFGFNLSLKQISKYKILYKKVQAEKEKRQHRYSVAQLEPSRTGMLSAFGIASANQGSLSCFPENASPLEAGAIKRLSLALPDKLAYLYFKRWALDQSNYWYKIGITNDPARRDAEQNVLPVPVENLRIICFSSTDFAKLVEPSLHKSFREHRIDGANNRELFVFDQSQYEAVMRVMDWIESRYSIPLQMQSSS
jgi:hypothetical protein